MTTTSPWREPYEVQKEHAIWFSEAEKVVQESPGKVLSEEQRRFYFENGYLLLENFLSADWVNRLRACAEAAIERSRKVSPDAGSREFILEPGHTPENPRLIRLVDPVGVEETFKEFTLSGPVMQVAQDLLGPDVRYHHSKMNFKWHSGGDAVAWHQDIQAWPHTNYSPLTIGVYLEDVDESMGPLGVVPKSHLGPLSVHRDPASGTWLGHLNEEEISQLDLEKVRYMTGKAGSVTVHNSRTVHGSQKNTHPTAARPLLLQTYAAANAVPLIGFLNGRGGKFKEGKVQIGDLVAGEEPTQIVFDPRPCPTAPTYSAKTGYKPVFFDSTKAKI